MNVWIPLRREAVDQIAGSEPAKDAGAAANRECERSRLGGDSVLGKQGGQIGDQAVLTKSRQHDDDGHDPEGRAAQCRANGCA